jgi:ATP-dependent exoDNAse (exonuclease V) beta subunit
MTLNLFDPDAFAERKPERQPPAPPRAPAPAPTTTAPTTRTFTPAQAAAIDERSHSLLLSAAAGSGKTAVLVERFVRAVLDDGVDPSRILAITFTDKAAGELRERIRRRFEELDTPQAREAARDTEGAFVSTIHGFCSRLLRSHPLAAGLDPGFAVLDEPRAARLREDAFAAALKGFLDAGGPAALDLVAAYRADALATTIPSVHDELRSQGQALPRLPHVAPRRAPDAERERLWRARETLAAELENAGQGKLVGEAREALERCARFLEDVEVGIVPWPGRMKALEIACGRAAALNTEACRAYVDARDDFERVCADHHAADHVALLDDLLRRFGVAYAQAKAVRGALDFDDLELGARDLLRDHPAVRAAWRERFGLLMVDEFQDTNRRQLEVLEALEVDDLFSVGDEFQSIYGFRHADVSIIRGRRDALAQRGLALRLEESFRCDPAILDAVNAAFAPRFGEHFAALRPPAGREAGEPPRVELLVTATQGWDAEGAPDLGTTLPPVHAWRRAEARLLAQRLRELVDAGESPGEIAILVRASASMPVLERALADVGLPSLATAGRGFWTRQEVVDLTAYLAALANPLDERALLTVLGSPLCGASSDALALLVSAARTAPRRELWAVLREDLAGGPGAGAWITILDPADRAALTAFVPRLAAERAAVARHSLDELLDRAITASGYDVTILSLTGGPRRMANVDKLQRLARAFEAAEGRDLRGFVDHAAALEQAQKREPEAAVDDPDTDAVRLMTVHAAKGLEFGVVAVADLGRKPNTGSPPLLVDGERVGLRLALLDGAKPTPALDHPALDAERREREAAEEQRVFYVALTRAKRRLLLSGGVPHLRGGTAPLTWLGPALVPDLAARFEQPEPIATADVDGIALTLSTPATFGVALRPDPAWRPLPDPQRDAAAAAAQLAAEVPAPPAALAPRAPGPLSYTTLAAYHRCGYRFYVQRVIGLPDRPVPPQLVAELADRAQREARERGPAVTLDPRVRGVVVHALLEDEELTPDAQRIRRLAAGEGATDLTDSDVADVQELLRAFAASGPARRLAAARRVRREHEFAFTLGELLLIGVLDALAVEADGTWLVVDFKTDRLEDPAADLEALVRRDYGVQRALYALAALRAGAQRVEVVHLYLQSPDAPATATFTPADEPELTAQLSRLTERLARGEYPLTAHPHAGLCATCPARDGLCPYPPERTLAPDASAERPVT